jgi:hypothetical protein
MDVEVSQEQPPQGNRGSRSACPQQDKLQTSSSH